MNIETPRHNIESKEEKEKFDSRIFLAFFRHSEKTSTPDALLTPEGRKLAKEKASEYHPEEIPVEQIRQAVAFGSPKPRAQETAGFVLGGDKEEITGEEDLEKLKEKLNQGLMKGDRIGVDENLDFYINKESLVGKADNDSFKRGEFLKFLVEESDKLAQECGDDKTITYNLAAANVAEIIQKYINVEKRWDELVKEKKYQPTMERYLGSHQGVTELFLAKVIDKTKGIEERNKFVQVLNNQGFNFVEGFKVEILNRPGGDLENPEIMVTYQKKDKEGKVIFDFQEKIDKKLIEEIIQEK